MPERKRITNIGTKKNALSSILPLHPQLEFAKEYYFEALDKKVRYLVPMKGIDNRSNKYLCKAIIFVKYEQGADLNFNTISKDVAFQQLIPDSWISPTEKNASRFLDWFLDIPSYQLNYSDNNEMVSVIDKLFQDEF